MKKQFHVLKALTFRVLQLCTVSFVYQVYNIKVIHGPWHVSRPAVRILQLIFDLKLKEQVFNKNTAHTNYARIITIVKLIILFIGTSCPRPTYGELTHGKDSLVRRSFGDASLLNIVWNYIL